MADYQEPEFARGIRIPFQPDRVLSPDVIYRGTRPSCIYYVTAEVEINGNLYDFFNDPSFIVPLMKQTAQIPFDRRDRRAAVYAALKAFSRTPGLWWKGARWLSRTFAR